MALLKQSLTASITIPASVPLAAPRVAPPPTRSRIWRRGATSVCAVLRSMRAIYIRRSRSSASSRTGTQPPRSCRCCCSNPGKMNLFRYMMRARAVPIVICRGRVPGDVAADRSREVLCERGSYKGRHRRGSAGVRRHWGRYLI